jgi:hypothetical protein
VISDRDVWFTSTFSKELMRLLGIQTNMSMAYHLQTDGQSECTNQWLEQYLRIYVNHAQDNWASFLLLAQFMHNSWSSSTTGFSPFDLLIGFMPTIDTSGVTQSALPLLGNRKEELEHLRVHVLRFLSFLLPTPAYSDTLDDYCTALTHGLPGIPF